MWQIYPYLHAITLKRRISVLACGWSARRSQPCQISMRSAVSEPQVAENRYLPLTGGIALTTVYALTCYTVISEYNVQIHTIANGIGNHKCNEVENAFPIFKVSRLVRVHTDSHYNGHNKMIFAVSDV